MQIKYELNSPTKTYSLLRKLVTLTVTVAMLGLVLMFSAVLLVIITIVGALAWVYLWWKTRELRKQMRDFIPREAERENKESDVGVVEGEVIRVVDTQNER
jgi:ABC-type bacteriocin/lantibiotic exporter with double-glycine peptidase domain